jgi:hypothetical protein
MVQHYTEDADRERLADQAMAKKRRDQSKNSKLSNSGSKLSNRRASR